MTDNNPLMRQILAAAFTHAALSDIQIARGLMSDVVPIGADTLVEIAAEGARHAARLAELTAPLAAAEQVHYEAEACICTDAPHRECGVGEHRAAARAQP